MFGRARDEAEPRVDDLGVDEILGDEQAADETARLDALRDRVEQVESQLASQFTSLAAYAQIAQEQVELVRSESNAAVERTEERLVALIERERSDRIATITGEVPAGSAPDMAMRVESMERTLAKIVRGLDDCLDRQLQLADAITRMFEHRDEVTVDVGVGVAPDVVVADPPAATPSTPATPDRIEAAPAAETPVAEAPLAETPVADAPVTEAPVADVPVVATPIPELTLTLPPLPAPNESDRSSAGSPDARHEPASTGDGPIPALALD